MVKYKHIIINKRWKIKAVTHLSTKYQIILLFNIFLYFSMLFITFPVLKDIISNENSVIMYPGKHALDLETLPPITSSQPPYNIIIIDGTWQQAKSMFYNSKQLHGIRQVIYIHFSSKKININIIYFFYWYSVYILFL